ncbi:MAG TPA: hypothetical protein VNM37_26295, partial [Candidatus Dormibacteraeota bacterium]|nr:hypothetical protein [Candidatus Dormibacteraeota bacterium]
MMGQPEAEAWVPEYQKEPPLEPPMLSPDDFLTGPATKGAMAAKMLLAKAAAMPAAAGAGIIRRGGLEDLVAIHQTSPRKLWPWVSNDKLPRELTAPSMAINRGNITQNFGDMTGTVTLVAKPDALDPKNVGGKLWARDTYTPRGSQFAGRRAEDAVRKAAADAEQDAGYGLDTYDNLRKEYLGMEARSRNWDRFNQGGFHDMRTMEFGAEAGGHQGVAILRSPNFTSYEGFENSPHGAGRLFTGATEGEYLDDVHQREQFAIHQLLDRFGGRFENMPGSPFMQGGPREFMRTMNQANAEGKMTPLQTRAWYSYLKDIGEQPSTYAEQKITAPIAV